MSESERGEAGRGESFDREKSLERQIRAFHWIRLLAERAARLGGRVSLVHDEDGGSTLRMQLPCPEAGP